MVVQWPDENSVDPDDRGFCSVHLDSQTGCLLLLQALVLQLAGDVLEAHPQPSLHLPLLLLLLHLLTQVQGLSGLLTALPCLDIALNLLLFPSPASPQLSSGQAQVGPGVWCWWHWPGVPCQPWNS